MNKWIMPKWMEQYRHLIVNTGGNKIEELLATNTSVNVNAPRALLENSVDSQSYSDDLSFTSVDAQVCLLEKLHNRGLLVEQDRYAD